MEKLKILEFPDKRLRRISEPITVFDQNLKTLSANMLKTMYEEKGVGLAAPQVNQPIRLIVMDISQDRDQPMVFVNPTVSSYSGRIESNEGCLSVPGMRARVARTFRIRLQGHDHEGNELDEELEGWDAIVAQHECDHLDGILYVDRITDKSLLTFEEEFLEFHQS